MRKIVFLLMTLLIITSAMGIVAAAEEYYADGDGLYTVELTLEPNNDYTIVAMKRIFDQTNYLEAYSNCNDSDIIYFGQATSDDEGKVVFGPFAPMGYYDATLILGGTSIAEPVLAGHLFKGDIKNDARIRIDGVESCYKVDGEFGENVVIDVSVSVFDSFGYPDVTNSKVFLTADGDASVNVDEGSLKIVVDKCAKPQTFTITAKTVNAETSVSVTIEREASRPYQIVFYSDDTYTQEITSINVMGVGGVFPETEVYALAYNQYGEDTDDSLSYTFNYGQTVSTPSFKPSAEGNYVLIATADNGVSAIIPVVVTNRPAYTGAALELYNLINACEAELKNVGTTVFLSSENGRDVFPEYMWTTSARETTFKTAISAAKTTLSQYDENTTQNSVLTSAITKLDTARSAFTGSFKPGVRVDIEEISITKQDIRLGINGSDRETIDLSDYLVIDKKTHTDKLTWSSSNEEYVKVTEDGVVSTNKNGTAIVSVTTRSGLTATTTVTTYTKIRSIEMSANVEVTYGDEPEYFTVTASPANQTDRLVWTNSNPEIAEIEVSADGLKGKIIPLSAGKTKVTVTVESSIGTSRVIYKEREVTVTMPEWDTVAKPAADVEAGVITKGTRVTLSTQTENAKIYYTLDGTAPNPKKNIGRLYVAPIAISQDLTLKAVAVFDGMYDSEVATYEYTVTNPYITVGSAITSPGTTADIDIKFENALSLKSLDFKVYYERANIIVSDYTVNESIKDYVECNINNTNGEFRFSFRGDEAVAWNEDEVLVTLKFSARSYADERVYTIGLGDVSMTDVAGNEIPVGMNEGKITVKTFTKGDADGNGKLSIADVVIIKQYVAGNQAVADIIDLRAADFDEDGEVTKDDATLLAKYFAG